MTEPDDTPRPTRRPSPLPTRVVPRRLATYPPHSLIIGDLAITPEGAPVPDDQVDHIHAVAAANGVLVYEMET